MLRDLKNNVGDSLSLSLAVHTNGTVNGAELDLQGFSKVMLLLSAGTRTDGTHLITIEESDSSGSGFTTVAAGDLEGSFAADVVTDTNVRVGYKGNKRYLRAVAVTSGATTGAVFGASFLVSMADASPVA